MKPGRWIELTGVCALAAATATWVAGARPTPVLAEAAAASTAPQVPAPTAAGSPGLAEGIEIQPLSESLFVIVAPSTAPLPRGEDASAARERGRKEASSEDTADAADAPLGPSRVVLIYRWDQNRQQLTLEAARNMVYDQRLDWGLNTPDPRALKPSAKGR